MQVNPIKPIVSYLMPTFIIPLSTQYDQQITKKSSEYNQINDKNVLEWIISCQKHLMCKMRYENLYVVF